jgi:uncharacterized protein
MENHLISRISRELGLQNRSVQAVLTLIEEGATVPFIARYRKEATGSLDEVAIGAIRDLAKKLEELEARRATILKSIEEQGKLTPDLRMLINQAEHLSTLEDIYLPYKPKRRTRATMAREKGLEPLAFQLMAQGAGYPMEWAKRFVDSKKGVATPEEALEGARDILAEQISENPEARDKIRWLFGKKGSIHSKLIKGKADAGTKFSDYFDWEEPLTKAPSHRILAMRRAEKEKIVNLTISVPEQEAIMALERVFLKSRNPASSQVALAIQDSFKRLLGPSIENEFRSSSKEKADTEAIKVFAENLRQLLLAAPLGPKSILAIDPGFRTGCKVVVLDKQGNLKHHSVIYPHSGQGQEAQAAQALNGLVRHHGIEAIAIGNGTAGRETEEFVRKQLNLREVVVVMVNESGASIYSASEVARAEFPDHDVTVRGAVSIGRRLMDPLAELVKLDPKSIGVGQYQHDVDQTQLKASLDDVVESCVNGVGVEINTASKQLLMYVSGLGPVLAEQIVNYRAQHGPFKSRQALMKVPRLGEKAFQLSAGFLRVRDGANPLDASAVHPERYGLVNKMAKTVGCKVEELLKREDLRAKIDLKDYMGGDVGLPTLQDILKELAKPGRDPRAQFEAFSFREGVSKMEDLELGMVLPGIVTNITRFGAFVDVGVHQDGMVHISEMADRFIKDPAEVVKVQQQVTVKVLDVDLQRRRISLSMKGLNIP